MNFTFIWVLLMMPLSRKIKKENLSFVDSILYILALCFTKIKISFSNIWLFLCLIPHFLSSLKIRVSHLFKSSHFTGGVGSSVSEKCTAHVRGKATRGLTERMLQGLKQNKYSRGQAMLGFWSLGPAGVEKPH